MSSRGKCRYWINMRRVYMRITHAQTAYLNERLVARLGILQILRHGSIRPSIKGCYGEWVRGCHGLIVVDAKRTVITDNWSSNIYYLFIRCRHCNNYCFTSLTSLINVHIWLLYDTFNPTDVSCKIQKSWLHGRKKDFWIPSNVLVRRKRSASIIRRVQRTLSVDMRPS